MNLALINLLAILTAILLSIFSVFSFNFKKGKTISNRILAAFLFANAMYLIDFSLYAIQKVTGLPLLWFSGLGSTFGFLFGPTLYLYIFSITVKDFQFRLFHLFHFLVFAIVFVLVFFRMAIPSIYIYSALHLQTTPYMVACIVVLLQYRKRIKDYFSSVEKLNLTWMLYVVGAFFFMWMVDLVDFILQDLRLITQHEEAYFIFISLLINFFFAILIFYKALQQPEIFKVGSNGEKAQKYEQSRLTDSEKKEYLERLEQFFIIKKPFLNPEITIAEVASELNVHSKYLSQAINESLGKNFYDFINSYRIEEAKKQLKNNIDSKKTVLEVLYESGFNSKSAFNSAFKKHTGFTPTEFKKQHS